MARAYPALAGQVLREVEPHSVPRVVRGTAKTQAVSTGARVECTRYFPLDEMVLAVLSAFCGETYGRDTDSRTILVVSTRGALLETVTWAPVRGEAELVPYYRFAQTTHRP